MGYTGAKYRSRTQSNVRGFSKVVVPARRSTLSKLVYSLAEPQWFRTQSLAQSESIAGFQPLANRLVVNALSPYDNYVVTPCHVYDLSCIVNYNNGVITSPDVGFAMAFSSPNSIAGAEAIPLRCTLPNGTVDLVGNKWQPESNSTANAYPAYRKAYHEYTSVKLELIGAQKQATVFNVSLIQLTEVQADFVSALSSNREKSRFLDWLTRPYMYSALNSGPAQGRPDCKILSSQTYRLNPEDIDSYGTLPGSKRTVNMFVRHNRTRRYDWNQGYPAAHGQAPIYDVETNDNFNVRVDPKYRVYLVIRAQDFVQSSVDDPLAAPDPADTPSYNIMLRNKWLFPV